MDEETFASAFNAHIEGWRSARAADILSTLILFHNTRAKKSDQLQLLDLVESENILMKYSDLAGAVKECRWSIVRSHREFASSFRLQSPHLRSCIAIAGKAAWPKTLYYQNSNLAE